MSTRTLHGRMASVVCALVATKSAMFTAAGVVAVTGGLGTSATAEVTFQWVTVGNPANPADPLNSGTIPGIGSVAYPYRIARYEVTNDQYAEFLNAVAATDTNALYNASMSSDARGGITRSGSPGSFAYSPKANMGNKPVNFVSFFDAMRFVNWLHNGQPTGAQAANTTEAGVYAISDGLSETRTPDAAYFIPTENEWYKTAYHDPRTQVEGGPPGDDYYWLYPTKSDLVPGMATAGPVGDISNPGSNVVNYYLGADWNGQNGNVTTVGSAGPASESFHATSDQGGNVFEWNQTVLLGSSRGVRGGSWRDFGGDPRSSNHFDSGVPEFEHDFVGFRVAGPVVGTCCISNGGCETAGNCQENITETECQTLGGIFLGPNVPCTQACVNGECIPAVSQWGLVALTLALLATATVLLRGRIRTT